MPKRSINEILVSDPMQQSADDTILSWFQMQDALREARDVLECIDPVVAEKLRSDLLKKWDEHE